MNLSSFANARAYYDVKKKSSEKAKKTYDQAEMAIKQAEKKSKKALQEVSTKSQQMHNIRKMFWFEKFYWFITTGLVPFSNNITIENYLVIAGREAQQNEILYKRYLKKGDLYVHAGTYHLVCFQPIQMYMVQVLVLSRIQQDNVISFFLRLICE